jgi:hypothetical protein
MRQIMNLVLFLLNLILLLMILAPLAARGGEGPTASLPVPSCGAGWSLDGKALRYDKETLSDRIDGEAELFFPYGFESLDYARYARGEDAFDLDVYRMGSTLDAFGMYASYRPDGSEPLRAGVEGAVTASQLFFYQGRYFVRLQSTGTADAGKEALANCAEAVSRLLPSGSTPPKELELVAIPEVARGSVRYNATSLLGYDFFPRGMTADASIAGTPVRLFLLLAANPAEAARSLAAYRDYLKVNGAEVRVAGPGSTALSGVDPLYGRVLAEQSGRYLFGLARVKDPAAAAPVMEKLRSRLTR